MIKWLLRRRLAAFERAWNYDASYMHEVLEADPSALMAFSKVASLGRYHKDAPLAAYHAVRIVGTMAEDCGPCTQLTVDMAVRAGVDPAVLRAAVSREFSAMPADVSLGGAFRRGEPASRARGGRSAQRGGSPMGQACADLARFRYHRRPHLPDGEIRHGPRPRLHPRDRRRRVAAGAS